MSLLGEWWLLRESITSQRSTVLRMIFRVRGEFLIKECLPVEHVSPWECVSLRQSLGVGRIENISQRECLGVFLELGSTHEHISLLGYLSL